MKLLMNRLTKFGLLFSLAVCTAEIEAKETGKETVGFATQSIEMAFNPANYIRQNQNRTRTTDVPRATVLSQQLWRTNTIYMRDAMQVAAAKASAINDLPTIEAAVILPQNGEESAIANLLTRNSSNINRFIMRSAEDMNSEISMALDEQALLFIDYIEAYQTDADQLPQIISDLQESNEELYQAIVMATSASRCERELLHQALETRLMGLKQLAQAFASTSIGEYDMVYDFFNESLCFSQRVGAIIADILLSHGSDFDLTLEESSLEE